MLNLNNYDAVFFDCDGVILQSNHIKTKVFAETLIYEDQESINSFISYHMKNGGISRYKKFEYFFKNIKQDQNYKNKSIDAVQKYSKKVFKYLISANFVPGFLNIINYLNNKEVPCYVISGGDQKELHKVFKIKGIVSNFQKIMGSPLSKFDHAANLNYLKLFDKSCILFGDSFVDMKIAKKYNIDFCFLSQFSEWQFGEMMSKKLNYYSIYNFNDPLVSFN